MSRQLVFQLILFLASMIHVMGEEAAPDVDRIEVNGGAILTGTIVDATAAEIQLRTPYAGVITVKTSEVLRIVTDKELANSVPAKLLASAKPVVAKGVEDQEPSSPEADKQPAASDKPVQAKPVVASKSPVGKPGNTPKPPPAKATAAKPPAKKPAPSNDKYGWEVEAGMNLSGNAGNADKLDLGINIDTRYEQKFYRVDLYARYSYGTNRERLTSNEIVLGSRYTNFFYKRFGFFIREELEHDKFEGIEFRSTTASGFSYKFYDTKVLDLEARSGLSYRFEEDDRGKEEDYPGMDFGVDVRWQFSPILSFKGSYGFIPSFKDSEAFIITQNSSVDIPFDRKSQWKIRLGLTTKYNNQPSRNRENLDHKYFIRLIATWK